MTERDRPSTHGKLLGDALAAIATAGREACSEPIPDTCLTCAFRPGALANESAGTGLLAMNCVLDIDTAVFCCHHGMKDGDPTSVCMGYVAAKLAPFEVTRSIMGGMLERVKAMKDGPDQVRADFDAWMAHADPRQELDVYQLARAYARR